MIDAVLPLSILNLGQVESLLLGLALTLILSSWISFELIGIVGRARETPAWWQVLRFGGCVVLLSLSGGSGMAMLPPLVLWMGGFIAWGWWSGRDPGPSARALGLGLLITTTAVVTYYLCGYQRPSIPPPPSIGAVVSTTLAFLSLALNPFDWGYWQIAGVAVALLIAVTLARLMLVAWRSPIERPRAFGLIAVLLSLLGVAVAVGLSRSGSVEPSMARASRYVSFSAPILSALYIIWLLYGSTPARRMIHTSLLVLVCAAIPTNARFARSMGEGRCALYTQILQSIRAGVPTSRLADRVCPNIFNDWNIALESFKMLKTARIGKFKHLVDDQIAAVPAEAAMR